MSTPQGVGEDLQPGGGGLLRGLHAVTALPVVPVVPMVRFRPLK